MSAPASASAEMLAEPLDVARLRADFPILTRSFHGHRLVYLDSANTTQKPEQVLRALDRYYREKNANIHRATYELGELATRAYEGARETVRAHLNAASAREIVFTRGTTESINLVARTFGDAFVKAGDEVVITGMEHHSNIVPWQLLSRKTKLVAVVHISNALGTVNPVRKIVAMAHDRGIPVLVDGAQSVPHFPIDVRALDCDFFAFSGHKVYGPTGIGVLYGKEKWLEAMPPFLGGGDMIASVTFEKTTYNSLPYKFEAGTANIAGGVGLAAALDYVDEIGLPTIAAHERDLLEYGTACLREAGAKLVGTAREKASVLSFVMGEIHPHDIGTILDQEGIAIRTGHHCAQPVMDRYGVPATARVSFGLYNTREEIDALAAGLKKVREVFG